MQSSGNFGPGNMEGTISAEARLFLFSTGEFLVDGEKYSLIPRRSAEPAMASVLRLARLVRRLERNALLPYRVRPNNAGPFFPSD